MRLYFDLPADGCGLTMVIRKWTVFSLPLPLALAPKSTAWEWAEGEDFCFDVPFDLPGRALSRQVAGGVSVPLGGEVVISCGVNK